MKSVAIAAVAAALSVSPVSASTLDTYFSSFFVIGDSLSDPGNFGPLGPPPPYAGNRFSNGPVWAEVLASEFDPSATQNYAFGGAETTDANPTPDAPEQVQFFLGDLAGLDGGVFPGTPVTGDTPLVAIWLGANDLFSTLDTLASVDPTDTDAQAAAALAAALEVTEAAKAVANIVGSLLQLPPFDNFVVLNMPNLGGIPAYNTTPLAPTATQLSQLFNLELALALGQLDNGSNDIEVVDVFALLSGISSILPNLTNVDEACFLQSAGTLCSNPEEYAFFDLVHPTTVVHAELAEQVRAAVVPLPATLPLAMAGLGALGLVRRRFA
ncbi:MAG: SGNH/GDSL hydrolase family protein [Pseudomonadota bacterium]